jgi:chemotaxis protein methyltransferase CheR
MTEALRFNDRRYERFHELILQRSGLYFPQAKRHALERGVLKGLNASSCTSLDEYYVQLLRESSSSPMWDELVGILTVGETYFFRNKGHFDALRQKILPELIEQRRRTTRRIRIWSAGCATGEEPYSVAMLLRQLIPNIESWNILILATDINRSALRQARRGHYRSWSFRGVDRGVRDTYFSLNGGNEYVINSAVKRMVTLDYLNLVEDNYPSLTNRTNGMDIILCRNVTIYFDPETTLQVITRFHRSLTSDGWLIPGASEPNMVFYQDFGARTFPGAVVYQKVKGALSSAKPASPIFEFESEDASEESGEAISADRWSWLREREEPDAETEQGPAKDAYEEALELVHRGALEDALVKLHEKLEETPDFVPTYYMLGKVYANKGNLEEAEQWCQRAIQRDKLQPEPYYTLSMIYQEHGLLDKAIQALKKTVYLDREFILAHYNLGQIYKQLGRAELAKRSFRNARRLLASRPSREPVPEGDGLVTGRLLQLVNMALSNGHE